jgi:hypothetical protein
MLVGWAACLPLSFVVIPLMDTGKPICYAVAVDAPMSHPWRPENYGRALHQRNLIPSSPVRDRVKAV